MGATVMVLIIIIGGLIISLIVLFLTIMKPGSYPDIEAESAGIIVHGLMYRGWIQNTNKYSMVVKCTVNSSHLKHTKWVQVLEPGQKIAGYHESRENYEIYIMDGLEVGFIHFYEP